MACLDCLKNCDPIISDKCTQYTGPDIPALGICTGDSLFQVDTIILDLLQEIAIGSGITLSDVTLDCTQLTTLLAGQPQTLENLVQVLLSAACATKAQLDALSAQVNATFSFSGACLTLPTNPTRDQVLQAVATKLCSISSTVDGIFADYVKASELCTLVDVCISGGSGAQEYTKMPKFVALPYHGPLSVFDGAGKGIAAAGYDKIYLCIGQTVGTFTLPDYRGRSPIGANTNVPGGAMDSTVDPSLSQNAGYSIVPGTKKGAYIDTLTITGIPAHNHPIVDSGHTHSVGFGSDRASGNNNANYAKLDSSSTSKTTSSSVTGITVGTAGGSQPHNNTHPVIGTNFIMYIP